MGKGKIKTTKEIAEYLSVSPEQIRKWVRSGTIPHTRLSRKLSRFNTDTVDAWLNDIRKKASPNKTTNY